MQDVNKTSKENVTDLAGWIKEKTQVKNVSLVLIRGNLEKVVPGRARRDLWEVERGRRNFGFDFIGFEVFS